MLKKMIFYIIFVMLIVSCRSDAPTASPPDNNKTSFRVALLLPRTINADGWNKAGYDGLKLIEEKLDADIAYSEAVPEDEFEQVFRQYAEDGYDFIIGHGGQFIDAAETVAAEFPRKHFAVTSIYEGNNQNLGGLSLYFRQVSYLVGVVAALKTETQHVGFLSGSRNPTNEELAQVYEKAVKDTNPDIKVTSVWTGSWTDEDLARTTTEQLIAEGVDVIVVIAGQVAPLVHQLAEKEGVYTIGWSIDQYDVAPDSVLVSVIENTPIMFLQGATLAQRGRWEGKQYLFGMAEDALYLTSFRGSLTDEDLTIVEDVRNSILSRDIDINP